MAKFSHLARRFFWSIRPGGPSAVERLWAEKHLLDAERLIWSNLPGPDRRHSAAVARRVEQTLGPKASRPVLAAALLHDCGKSQAGLRTPGRVVATVLGELTMKSPEQARQWAASSSRIKKRFGEYRLHPEFGASILAEAGSDPLTVTWTNEHHLPVTQWTLASDVAAALSAADDD